MQKIKVHNVEIKAQFKGLLSSKLPVHSGLFDITIKNHDSTEIFLLLPGILSDTTALPEPGFSKLIELYKFCDTGCVYIITFYSKAINGNILQLPPHATIIIRGFGFGLKEGLLPSKISAGIIENPMINEKKFADFFQKSIISDSVANVKFTSSFDDQIGAYNNEKGEMDMTYSVSQIIEFPISQ